MKVSFITAASVAAAALLGGCAEGSLGGLTTASVTPGTPTVVQKVDPACGALASQISTLRGEGVADKVEKAAVKKYKMTTADLAKADQLNKANAEFQGKCTGPSQQTAAADPAAAAASAAATDAGNAAAAKATSAATAKATTAAAGVVAKQ